jgi:phage terminase large subunit-like protein
MAPSQTSPAQHLALLPAAERTKVMAALSDEEAAALEYDWPFWARPNQLTPAGSWKVWLILAGRGWG